MINVVIAEHQPVIRAGLRTMLSVQAGIRIVAEAFNEKEAQQLAAKLQPQVLLLDLKLPGLSPSEIGKWARANFAHTATLVLTTHQQEIYLANLIEAGMAGMLDLEVSPKKLAESIRRAARGEILFDEQQVELAQNWQRVAGRKWESLRTRQKQILLLIAQGTSRKEVAPQLEIGRSAVEYHIGNLLENLKFKSLLEAVCWLHKYFPDDLRTTTG